MVHVVETKIGQLSLVLAVDDWLSLRTGKKSLAMEAFARALRQIPATIADNAGLDSAGRRR
jgi:T-complex protein 1 subunit beta